MSFGQASVLVVTASMGAGHQQVAAELGRRLDARGIQCTTVDVCSDARFGRALRTTYRQLLAHAPAIYDVAMRFWAWRPGVSGELIRWGSGPMRRTIRDAIDRTRPDLIVSTYNLASQCLGALTTQGRIDAPVITLVTDPGPHPYWVHPAVRAHLTPSELTSRALRTWGATDVRTVGPLLRPEFQRPPSRSAARSRLRLDPPGCLAVISSGAWTAGAVRSTVAQAHRAGATSIVVLCGNDGRLREDLAALPHVLAVPWTSEVIDYLAAADVMIDNAGGVTCREALACRTPVVLVNPLPGHGPLNAAALEQLGWARWARDETELAAALDDRIPPPETTDGTDPAEVVEQWLARL